MHLGKISHIDKAFLLSKHHHMLAISICFEKNTCISHDADRTSPPTSTDKQLGVFSIIERLKLGGSVRSGFTLRF